MAEIIDINDFMEKKQKEGSEGLLIFIEHDELPSLRSRIYSLENLIRRSLVGQNR